MREDRPSRHLDDQSACPGRPDRERNRRAATSTNRCADDAPKCREQDDADIETSFTGRVFSPSSQSPHARQCLPRELLPRSTDLVWQWRGGVREDCGDVAPVHAASIRAGQSATESVRRSPSSNRTLMLSLHSSCKERRNVANVRPGYFGHDRCARALPDPEDGPVGLRPGRRQLMAKRPHRYTEARMYLVGGSVGMLLIVWSALAMKDLASSATTSAQTPVALIPPAAAAATPQPAVGPASSSGGSTAKPRATAKPNATAFPRPTQQPQTRSRGS